jgi:molybdopterin-containing oxidoreductase family iron-sulfur binding subunit
MEQHLNPDRLEAPGILEGPAVRPKGVVEKCTFCVHRLTKARARAEAEQREFRADEYVPACVQTCTGNARYFGDLDDPGSTVSRLAASARAFRVLEEAGTHPKVIYLQEG